MWKSLLVGSVFAATAFAQGSPQMELANLREDVRGLTQRVGKGSVPRCPVPAVEHADPAHAKELRELGFERIGIPCGILFFRRDQMNPDGSLIPEDAEGM